MLVGVYQRVYEVRHRVWSHRGRDVSAGHAPQRAASVDVDVVQSTDDEEPRPEKPDEREREKKDHEHHRPERSSSEGQLPRQIIAWQDDIPC